jgi:acyl carrier protein
MATKEEIYEIVKTALIDDFEIEEDEIVEGVNIYEDLDLDSLDAIDLMVTLDKRFEIETKPEVMHNVTTLKALTQYIEKALIEKENG